MSNRFHSIPRQVTPRVAAWRKCVAAGLLLLTLPAGGCVALKTPVSVF
jgi:hypothetical protein